MIASFFAKVADWLKTAAGITVSLFALMLIVSTWYSGLDILINTIITGGMLSLVAMGLALVFGVLNVPMFAHGEFFMIGGLTAYYVMQPILRVLGPTPSGAFAYVAPFIAIGSAAIIGAIMGVLAEVLCIRPLRRRVRGNWVMNSFLLTVGMSVILVNAHQLLFGTEFKGISKYWPGRPFFFMDSFIPKDRLLAFVLAVVVIVGFWLFMKYTRTGRAIRAVSQDETGSLMVGINLDSITMLTMAVGCSMAAVAGASLLSLYPSTPTSGLEPLYMAWFVVILVGLGNVLGALLGGFMVALLKILTSTYVGEGWEFVVPSAFIILVLIFKPSGIFGSEVRGILDQ